MITWAFKKLLLFFYGELVDKGERTVESQDVLNATKWESNKINLTYNYLDDLGLLKASNFSGNLQGVQMFRVLRLLPMGINIVENKPEFKKTFGFEVNLGLVKFSWSTTEK